MSNELRFDGKVVIITGAGNGLGRSHALLFGSRGAKVIVNDLGGSAHGEGKSSAAADKVVAEIKAGGGEAAANYDSVEDGDKIVQSAMDHFGAVDIIVNNAGILRDTTFHKMSASDWELIYRVHVLGAFKVTHAAWNHMRDKGYGRIIFTSSAAGLYGNFGQANYGMAKMGLVGLSNTLALEGKKKGVLVNTIAPIAGSRLTETVMPKDLTDALKPEFVSPLVAYLAHESCAETGGVFEVGGGFVGKLRWERTEGHSFKLARALTPEAVAAQWAKITDFGKSTHPADIASAMDPVMANLSSAKSRGGNEFIDVDEALAAKIPEVSSSYDEKDVSLYALSVGAAHGPLDNKDLQLVYEMHGEGFRTLPTFGVVQALSALFKNGQAPGLNFGFERILHGEQYTEVKRPLPTKATLKHRARVKDIFDKGKNAVVLFEIKSFDEAGNELIVNEASMVVRGAGAWGGDRGPSGDSVQIPDRAPDAVVEEKIGDNQALLYRLSSGDWNPLHADPGFASNFGFQKPILHGLCTYGFAGRHVIKSFLEGDPRRFKSIKARFSDTVTPGETIRTEMWRDGERVLYRCKIKERDATVISGGVVELYKEIPQEKAAVAAAAPKAASAAPASAPAGQPASADVFYVIGEYVKKHPELVQKVNTVFQFKLTEPASVWTIDMKKGAVAANGEGTPDVTLELSDADFMGMTSGKLDPQKLYFGGKLKIAGNVMASQKLSFLTKMDPKEAAAILAAKPGGSAATTTASEAVNPPASGSVPTEPGSADVFYVIGEYVKKNPALVGKVNTIFQFKLTDPASVWTIDMKNAPGAVAQGTLPAPDVTLELSDADFMGMTSGKLDPQKLYFGGKLKIAGNVMASQKLSFLTKMDPKEAAAILAARGGMATASPAPAATTSSGGASASAASSGAPKAPELFRALSDRLAKNPALAAEVGAVLQFKLKSPDSAWVLDLKGAPAVREGTDSSAASTFTLEEEDLASLLSGAQSPRELFQRGKLRVDGDMRVAQKLQVLRQGA